MYKPRKSNPKAYFVGCEDCGTASVESNKPSGCLGCGSRKIVKSRLVPYKNAQSLRQRFIEDYKQKNK